MSRSIPKQGRGRRSNPNRRPFWKPLRPRFELLEDRTLLDSSPAAIVVGRTLSSHTVGGVQNNQETITYTVYNEQADTETGVLLTTTLQAGVTYASASVAPDQSGQNLAWSLGTIAGYDRASVSLTVNLTTPTPTVLDSGATAYAILDAAAVSNATPAATLSTLTVPAGTLDSTPDANTTDPYIQEEAAKLDYDPTNIFNFLHNDIAYNSYDGSLRGARGTLWSGAGNALDVASLGVALLRASGIPSQYVSGSLSFSQAQTLILTMFPASDQTVGYIPQNTTTSNPADDDQLLDETENHYWFQFETATGFQDADPLMPGATIGQTFTPSTGTFTEVAQDLRATTEIKLRAQIYSQAGALFGLGGGNGLSSTTVLDQTFNDVDLVGRTLTVGNLVSTSAISALVISTQTTTYTPYVIVGGDSFDPSQDETITGTPYQDVETNFPLASQVVAALSLEVDLSSPGSAVQTFDRTLASRIGTAAGANGDTSVSVDPNGPPLVSPLDLATLSITASQYSQAAMNSQVPVLAAVQQQLINYQSQVVSTPAGPELDALDGEADDELRNAFIAMARSRLAGEFDVLSVRSRAPSRRRRGSWPTWTARGSRFFPARSPWRRTGHPRFNSPWTCGTMTSGRSRCRVTPRRRQSPSTSPAASARARSKRRRWAPRPSCPGATSRWWESPALRPSSRLRRRSRSLSSCSPPPIRRRWTLWPSRRTPRL